MFGRRKKQAKELAAKAKSSEPKIDDVKADIDIGDIGETFNKKEKVGKVDVSSVDDGAKSFGDAFKDARKSGLSVFTWKGKEYNTEVKSGGSKPASNSSNPPPGSYGYKDAGRTPGGQRIRQTVLHQDTPDEVRARHDANVASERAKMAARPKPPAPPVQVAPDAATRTFPRESQRGGMFDGRSRTYGGSDQRGAPMQAPRNQAMDDYNRIVADAALKDAKQKQLIQQMGMAKGGKVGYSKMEKEHVSQMKKHGVPEKYVKEEQKEAMGMKRGGMACGGMKKYARGGGIESKGKTKGTFVKMASGGSVSSRADGIAQRGKTNCKMR